jgi:putative ABC transport system substrate-binding protein
MARKTIIVVWLVALALAPFRLAEAQQAKKVHRIGYLTSNTSSAELPRFDAFRQALRELGHVEGQNITIEYRYAEGRFDRLPGFAAELVGLKVDVLVGVTTNAVQAAKNATRTIPIIFIGVSDPVAAELVDSLARPGETSRGY